MNWNRKEVGGLLLVGASVISGFQTALFSKWVDARLVNNQEVAKTIGMVGLISIAAMALIWLASRIVMNAKLSKQEKLNWRISLLFMLGFLAMAIGWFFAL